MAGVAPTTTGAGLCQRLSWRATPWLCQSAHPQNQAKGLATPAAIMAGTGIAARFGILIKDPQVLELAHRLNVVAFDKTGTLTIGKPRLLEIIPFSNAFTQDDILATAAGLQLGSEHPLAKALLGATKQQGLNPITPT